MCCRTTTVVLAASIVLAASCGADRRSAARDPGVDAVAQGGSGGTGGHSPNDAGVDVKIIVDVRDALATGKDVAMDARVVDSAPDRGGDPSSDAIPPSGGLVLYWTFDEGSGVVAKDSSGNGLDGSLAARNGGPPPSWVPGKKGSALELNRMIDPNGSYQVQYVELPHAQTNGLLDIAADEDLTISAWVNRQHVVGGGDDFYGGDSMCIIAKHDGWPEHPGFLVHILHDAYPRALEGFVSDGILGHLDTIVPKAARAPTTILLPMTGWHHVAFVFDHHSLGNCRWYLDGDEVAVTRFEYETKAPILPTGGVRNGLSLTLGRRSAGNEAPFNGMIDEVRIYKRALTISEVQALHANP